MHLKPLQQWICDSCQEVIEGSRNGYLEWLWGDDHRNYGFRIVHHAPASPRYPDGDCYKYTQEDGKQDFDLDSFVGQDGMVHLLSLLHPGTFHAPNLKEPTVRDVREWLEVFRRLQIPYYEEARRHMARARSEGFADDWNELLLYLPRGLKDIIKWSEESSE